MTVWWWVGAWLVALALCVRWVWRSTEVDEMMSPEWLHRRKCAEEEENHGARQAEEEDVAEAQRIQASILKTYEEEGPREARDALDNYYRSREAADQYLKERAPRSTDRRDN